MIPLSVLGLQRYNFLLYKSPMQCNFLFFYILNDYQSFTSLLTLFLGENNKKSHFVSSYFGIKWKESPYFLVKFHSVYNKVFTFS